jgi:antitoxin (DNA-binding transcriptional repressor) of toxin-antitoxin stability system
MNADERRSNLRRLPVTIADMKRISATDLHLRTSQIVREVEKGCVFVIEKHGGPFKPTASILSTGKGNAVYLHVLEWTDDEINLPPLPRKIKAGTLLTGGRVQARQTGERLTIRVPRQYRQDIDALVKLELDGPALDIAPIQPPGPKAAASNVYQNRPQCGPDKAVDNNPSTAVGNGAGSRERSRPGMAPSAPGR